MREKLLVLLVLLLMVMVVERAQSQNPPRVCCETGGAESVDCMDLVSWKDWDNGCPEGEISITAFTCLYNTRWGYLCGVDPRGSHKCHISRDPAGMFFWYIDPITALPTSYYFEPGPHEIVQESLQIIDEVSDHTGLHWHTTSSDLKWLTTSPTSGYTTSSQTITLTADAGDLPSGTYYGTVTVSADEVTSEQNAYTYVTMVVGSKKRVAQEGGSTVAQRAVATYAESALKSASLSSHRNYPNPFNPSTTIRYAVPSASHVTVSVYDTWGRSVRTLAEGYHEEGEYSVVWDGRDQRGEQVSSGVYLCRVVGPQVSSTIRMTLVR